METNKLRRVLEVSREFTRQWFLWRESLELEAKGTLPILICNNFYDMALLQWGHLYGNFKDDLHFKNVLHNADEFKRNIQLKLGVTDERWNDNWKSLRDFRDQHVAHKDIDKDMVVPELEMAYICVSEYYSAVRSILIENSHYAAVYDEKLSQFVEKNRVYYQTEIRKVFDVMRASSD